MYFQHHSGTSLGAVSLRKDANGTTCGLIIAWVDSASFRRAIERRYPLGLLNAEEIQALIEPFTDLKTGMEYICTPPVPHLLPPVAQSEPSHPPLSHLNHSGDEVRIVRRFGDMRGAVDTHQVSFDLMSNTRRVFC